MTHLRGNLLVMKTHPRIAFRGKVDTIQAKVLLLMAEYRNEPGLYKDLADILNGLREVLGSEVKEEEIAGFSLFGLDEKEIHRMSHQVDIWDGSSDPGRIDGKNGPGTEPFAGRDPGSGACGGKCV